MQNDGLKSLAESYALERNQLQQVKLLSEQMFEEICGELAALCNVVPRLGDLKLRMTSGESEVLDQQPTALGLALEHGGAWVALLTMNRALAHALVDYATGSDQHTDDQAPARPLTKIELQILSDTAGAATTHAFNRVLAALFGLTTSLCVVREMASHHGTIPMGRVTVARTECKFGGVIGELTLSLPLSILLTVRHKLDQGARTETARLEQDKRTAISALHHAVFELHAVLAVQTVTLDLLATLRPGAVLMFGRMADNALRLELCYQGQTLFSGFAVEDRGWRKFLIERRDYESCLTK
jgi:flagellar motor switch protein FliM